MIAGLERLHYFKSSYVLLSDESLSSKWKSFHIILGILIVLHSSFLENENSIILCVNELMNSHKGILHQYSILQLDKYNLMCSKV